MTHYGWRKQREQRLTQPPAALQTSLSRATSVRAGDLQRRSSVRVYSEKVGYFLFHFAEMWFGMAVFMVVRIVV